MDDNILSLIELARSGDGNSFADLTVLFKPLIESMGKRYASKCGNVLFTEDDFMQEATWGFYSAVQTYKPTGSVTFGLYAKICVRNRLVSLLRTASKKLKVPKENAEKRKGYGDPAHSFLEGEDARRMEKKIEELLSVFEYSVFRLYMQNKSYKEIADSLGRSVKAVDNALYRIKTKLKGMREL
ncbi:MAG: sigma-70 family RNA polymerase sigma factor [Clostridia bacterium]|nr:sigma-70 family RNA polymerase sigma factor [Clostridia bacterium]